MLTVICEQILQHRYYFCKTCVLFNNNFKSQLHKSKIFQKYSLITLTRNNVFMSDLQHNLFEPFPGSQYFLFLGLSLLSIS